MRRCATSSRSSTANAARKAADPREESPILTRRGDDCDHDLALADPGSLP
jgi:hypothetical protein